MLAKVLLLWCLGNTMAEEMMQSVGAEDLGLSASELESQAASTLHIFTELTSAGIEAPPDLNGQWVTARVEGDPEKLLQALGMSWFERRLAKTVNYGVGKMHKNFIQNGDHFRIEVSSPAGKHVEEFTVGVGREKALDAKKNSIERDIKWEGHSLFQQVWKGNLFFTVQTYVERGATAQSDTLVRRTRCGDAESTEFLKREN